MLVVLVLDVLALFEYLYVYMCCCYRCQEQKAQSDDTVKAKVLGIICFVVSNYQIRSSWANSMQKKLESKLLTTSTSSSPIPEPSPPWLSSPVPIATPEHLPEYSLPYSTPNPR